MGLINYGIKRINWSIFELENLPGNFGYLFVKKETKFLLEKIYIFPVRNFHTLTCMPANYVATIPRKIELA